MNEIQSKTEALIQKFFIKKYLNNGEKEELKYVFLFFIVLFLSLVIPPFEKGAFDICFFKNLTNLPCPGCGLTRSFIYLGHGAISDSIRMNPFGIIFFTGWAWVSLKDLAWIGFRKKLIFLPQSVWSKSKKVFLFALIGFGIVRIFLHLNEFEFLHVLKKTLAAL